MLHPQGRIQLFIQAVFVILQLVFDPPEMPLQVHARVVPQEVSQLSPEIAPLIQTQGDPLQTPFTDSRFQLGITVVVAQSSIASIVEMFVP